MEFHAVTGTEVVAPLELWTQRDSLVERDVDTCEVDERRRPSIEEVEPCLVHDSEVSERISVCCTNMDDAHDVIVKQLTFEPDVGFDGLVPVNCELPRHLAVEVEDIVVRAGQNPIGNRDVEYDAVRDFSRPADDYIKLGSRVETEIRVVRVGVVRTP